MKIQGFSRKFKFHLFLLFFFSFSHFSRFFLIFPDSSFLSPFFPEIFLLTFTLDFYLFLHSRCFAVIKVPFLCFYGLFFVIIENMNFYTSFIHQFLNNLHSSISPFLFPLYMNPPIVIFIYFFS